MLGRFYTFLAFFCERILCFGVKIVDSFINYQYLNMKHQKALFQFLSAMKITGPDLLGLKIVDQIIPEPIGGAHRHVAATMRAVGDAIEANLAKMDGLDAAALRQKRRERFLAIGRLEAEAG